MDIKMIVQSTPNPNALKFILNVPVKMQGSATYRSAHECGNNGLAAAIFSIANVREVYFFDNYITVTQDGDADWDDLEDQIKKEILENVADHNPVFETEQEKKPVSTVPASPELTQIQEILDRTIRPALQMDGGDLQIVGLDGNVLTVNYQGACGSCPSSTMGTLKAIENILRNEYNPELVVEMAAY